MMQLITHTPAADDWRRPVPAEVPTMYFIGVTTARSSIRPTFGDWASELGLGDVRLEGVDIPVHAPPAVYRDVVDWLASDPLSRGALVTTHKIDLYQACQDMFDEVDPAAALMGETSCLSKRGNHLRCHAKDPISSGLAIDGFIPVGYWADTRADCLLLGAGGSAIAISWFLTRPERATDRPRKIVVTNRSAGRLETIRRMHADISTDLPIECVTASTAGDNDAVLARLSPHSLVVNATGLGKDAPGSPLTSQAVFPEHAVAWDLNYRGDLVFLDQARSAGCRTEDGWVYFLHGWTRVIAEVFDIAIPTSGPEFDQLAAIAGRRRMMRS
jgi:shikimate 5-dehydrogenase